MVTKNVLCCRLYCLNMVIDMGKFKRICYRWSKFAIQVLSYFLATSKGFVRIYSHGENLYSNKRRM
jgi:hypothetical protein